MGFIRERKLKNGSTRFQAEIRLKGISKSVTAVFDRKTDAKAWIQKVEADIRCGRQQLYKTFKVIAGAAHHHLSYDQVSTELQLWQHRGNEVEVI